MKKEKKQVAKISVFITSIFVIFLSITYAFINQTLTGNKRQVITSGNLELVLLEDENNLSITNALPMYDEVGMIQDAFTFRLMNRGSVSVNYILKLEEIGVDGGLLRSDVKYGFTKDNEQTIDFVSNIEGNIIDEGTILGSQTIEYSLRLWVRDDITDITRIQNKSIRFKMNMNANQVVEEEKLLTVSEMAFTDKNLGDACKTYNDEVDTFLVGKCSKNYVWYSGKLWRIVLKNNETGAVKLVTDNAMTIIGYNPAGQTNFENSYVDQWLNQEFLPTLHDYENYLVTDSAWNATKNLSSKPARPAGSTAVERTVGLLNSYEYYTTYNNSEEPTDLTTYLNDGVHWWTLTPYDTSNVWSVNRDGSLSNIISSGARGVRPSVNLQSNVQISSGKGSLTDPYRLVGDKQEMVGGITLLSTRYDGEYINFNNELYRIVGVEDGRTKITAVDKPTALLSNIFDSNTTNFSKSRIKTDLQNYYNNNIIDSYKYMVEENMVWYSGAMTNGASYKVGICLVVNEDISTSKCEKSHETVNATIGLPRIGEMLTSQITRGEKVNFWTLNPYNTSYVWEVNYTGNLGYNRTANYGARPSMYLKQNVVISKDNTGDGTYEHPYDIELGA